MPRVMPTTSRRNFLQGGAATAALLGSSEASGQSTGAAFDDEITLVLLNCKIPMMDTRDTVVNTVSIRHDRFVAVGGRPPKAGRAVRVIDLRGRTVVPGLIEPHIHIVSLGNRPGY